MSYRIGIEYLTRSVPKGGLLACVRATVFHDLTPIDFVEGQEAVSARDVHLHSYSRAGMQAYLRDRIKPLEGAVYGRARLMVDILDGTVGEP